MCSGDAATSTQKQHKISRAHRHVTHLAHLIELLLIKYLVLFRPVKLDLQLLRSCIGCHQILLCVVWVLACVCVCVCVCVCREMWNAKAKHHKYESTHLVCLV